MASQTVTITLNALAQNQGFNSFKSGLNGVKTAAMDVDDVLKRTALSVGALVSSAVGIGAMVSGFKSLIATGIRFNATVESARLGIAAAVKTFNPKEVKDFATALNIADTAVEKLKKSSLETAANFSELVTGLQSVSGLATSAGIALTDQVDLIVMMSQSVAAAGLNRDQLVQETRALLSGNITVRSATVATMLEISDKEMAAARRTGTVMDLLRGKMKDFIAAGKIGMTNYTQALSNLSEVFEQRIGAAMLPMFNALKATFLSFTKELFKADLASAFTGISGALVLVIQSLSYLGISGIKHIKGLTAAVEVLSAAFALLGIRIAASLSLMGVRFLLPIIGGFLSLSITIGQVSTAFGFASGLGAVLKSLSAVSLVLFAGFAGWKAGRLIGEIQILGASINDILRVNILLAMKAWEEFKLSIGGGSLDQLAVIQKSIKDSFSKQSENSGKKIPKLSGTGLSKSDSKALLEARRAELELDLKFADLDEKRLRSEGLLIVIRGQGWELTARTVRGIIQERDAILRVLDAKKALIEQKVKDRQDAKKDGVLGEAEARKLEIEDEQELLSLRIERLNLHKEVAKATLETTERLLKAREAVADETFMGRLTTQIKTFGEEFEHVGARVADVLVDGVRSAIDAVAYGLWAVIDGTRTWGDVFLQVGRQIISQLIAIAIQELIVDRIKKAVMTAWSAFQSTMRAKDVVEANATEIAKTPALATNATLASIGSWGIAVAIGVAAIAAIMASFGAFEAGGVVAGGKQAIVVNESGPEAVLNSRATAMLGHDTINKLNSGVMGAMSLESRMASGFGGSFQDSGSVTSGSVSGSGQDLKVSFVLVDSRNSQAARDFITSSEGRVIVAEVVRDQRTEVGVS